MLSQVTHVLLLLLLPLLLPRLLLCGLPLQLPCNGMMAQCATRASLPGGHGLRPVLHGAAGPAQSTEELGDALGD